MTDPTAHLERGPNGEYQLVDAAAYAAVQTIVKHNCKLTLKANVERVRHFATRFAALVHCARAGIAAHRVATASSSYAIGEVDAVLGAAKECTRCQLKLSSMSTATDCNMLDRLCPIWGTHGHLWDGDEDRSRAAYAASIATEPLRIMPVLYTDCRAYPLTGPHRCDGREPDEPAGPLEYCFKCSWEDVGHHAAKEQEARRRRCLAGLQACARAGTQTPAMFALNRHVLGTHAAQGVGFEAAADALLVAGFDPPENAQWFSAAAACNLLGITA